MMNIDVISSEIVKPYNPTPDHLRYLRSSLFDHVNTPVLMPLIFLYSAREKHSSIGSSNSDYVTFDNVTDRLKGSLPYTLSMFYPLAGRVKNVNHIVCNDEGVPYVEAKVTNTCLDDLIHKAEPTQLDQLLTSHGNEGYTKLLLAIQVTSFTCGGVAIGVKMSHAISDGFSLLMFVKTWAAITQGKDPRLLPHPYFEIWKIFPPLRPQLSNNMDAPGEPNPSLVEDRPVTKRFMISEAKLNALRSALYSNCTYNTSLPSLAMVLSAFIWSRVKVSCHNDHDSPPSEVFHAVNIRPKVSPPTQSYYFGNMVVNAIAKLRKKENLCYDFLEGMKKSIAGIISQDIFVSDMKAGREDLRFMMELFERDNRGEIVLLGFSNIKSLPVYESDFGWGKPVCVTSATLVYKDLVILIPAGPSSKDIDAYINLSEEDMAKLLMDQEFHVFCII